MYWRCIKLTNQKEDVTKDNYPLTSKREEMVVQILLTVGIPLLILGLALGVIVLAFAGWKLY